MNATETLKQIGAANLMACGARDFLENAEARSLTFRVGSASRRLEKVIVTLDPSDTYTVRFVSMRRPYFEIVVDESISFVHADQLGAVVRKLGDR